MKSKLFFRHIKNNILRYTVALSAVVHLIGIFMFPSWGTVPDLLKKDKVIKIKTVIVKPDEKQPPKPEKKKPHEISKPPKELKKIIPQIKEKTTRVISVKAVTPSPAEKRIPVPLHHSKQIFQPVKAIQHVASIPNPVVSLQKMAETKISSAIPASSRSNPSDTSLINSSNAQKKREATKLFLSFSKINTSGPIKQVSNSSETPSPHPVILRKQFTREAMIAGSKTSRVAFSSSRENFSDKGNPLIQPNNIQPWDQRMAVAPARRVSFASRVISAPEAGIRVHSPHDVDFVLSTQSQRIITAAGAYSTPPSRTTTLMQMASIPARFEEETIIGNSETHDNKPSGEKNSAVGANGNSGENFGQIKKEFSSQVWTKIAQSKFYPRLARKRGFEGEPVVAFTLGNTGDLLEASINSPSPYKMLDKAALDAVKSASPYPPIPEVLKMKTIRFKLPISFILEAP